MESRVELIALVPREQDAGFEATVYNEVLPLVDTEPTRGGQIMSQVLLRHQDGRYLWLVGYKTTGGAWHEENLARARARLESMATIYDERSFQLLASGVRRALEDETFHEQFPVGLPGATVRIYHVTPRAVNAPDAFERSMTENVLPAVHLHYANRLGHTTDSQLLLKQVRPGPAPGDADRYQWWISRSLYESFKDRDSFPSDVREALAMFEEVGNLAGFEDYQILPSHDLR